MTDVQAIEQHEEILAGLVGERPHSRIREANTGRAIQRTYNADGSMAKVPVMRTDFEYTIHGELFAIYPNTEAATVTVRAMINLYGANKLTWNEFRAFRSQARSAGYSVRRAVPVTVSDAELAELLECDHRADMRMNARGHRFCVACGQDVKVVDGKLVAA